MGVCKEGGFEQSGMKEEGALLSLHQAYWYC